MRARPELQGVQIEPPSPIFDFGSFRRLGVVSMSGKRVSRTLCECGSQRSPRPPFARALSTAPRASPRVIFSGIQPTGVPHVGNLLGALQQWRRLQDAAESSDRLLFCVVGLHAITLPQDPVKLRQERQDMLAALLAIGLDPQRVTLFHQEHVPEHAELAWILSCLTPVGHLRRMTTWKVRRPCEIMV